MKLGLRMNTGQVTRAQTYFGRRVKESVTSHHKVVPKQCQLQGEGGLWAKHYHDASDDMETYTPPKGGYRRA